MAFRMTERARAAKVRREWQCDQCELTWTTVDEAEDFAAIRALPFPTCPNGCDEAIGQVFRPVGIKSIRSKARDVVWEVAQRDYGQTNMRDDIREGERLDIAPPPIQTAEAEAITREMMGGHAPPEVGEGLKAHVQNFFGATHAAPSANPMQRAIQSQLPQSIDAARAMAAPAAHEARAMGADPIGLLHGKEAKKTDPLAKRNLTIMSKGT